MMTYGMPYMGSKSQIAEWVVGNLPDANNLYDLFGGGGAITDCAAQSGKYKKIIYNDIDSTIVNGFLKAVNRLTIAHEIAHCFLHRGDKVSFARMENVPAYMNPEWQANAFAGEVLAPYKCVKDMDISAISEHYGVSKQSAIIQKSRVH